MWTMQIWKLLLAATLVLLCAQTRTACGQRLSLSFSNEMILRDMASGAEANTTDEFVSQITSAVNGAAGTGALLNSSVYRVPPHLVVVTSAWSTGEAADVDSQMSSLSATFDGWRQNVSSALYNSINQVCLDNIGRQPSVIDVTNACAFHGSSIDPESVSGCRRVLRLAFLTTSDLSNTALQEVLCRLLPTDCALVNYTGTTRETILVTPETVSPGEQVQPVARNYRVLSFTVAAEDREAVLVTLVNSANYASVLSAQRIAYIRADGVQVYYEGQEPALSYQGNATQCASHFWYLIFLILLLPITLVLGQRSYLMGRRSGSRSIMKEEKEIRAGVHLAQNPWGALGPGGMPGYGQQAYGMQGGGMAAPPGYGQDGGRGWPSMRAPGAGAGYDQQQQQMSDWNVPPQVQQQQRRQQQWS